MKRFLTRKDLKFKKKQTIYAFICIILVVGLYFIFNKKEKPAIERPIVCVEPVIQENVEIYGDYVGRIRAQLFVEVRARVEGFLERMHFEEGSYVKKDQVLFVINQDQYRAKADKARAQLKKDEATALKAKRDLDRIRPLYEQNAASQLDLDNAIAAYETAEASVGMSKADLEQAEQELGYTIVRSPISGHISERLVDPGTLVGTGGKSLLATIVKSDTVNVDFSMTTVTLPDNTVYEHKGLVDFAAPQVNPKTGTFQVRAELPNPEHVLLPGQFTSVKVLLDVRENATVIPKKSLIIEKGGSYVFVMRRDSVAERRFIEIGPEFKNDVVVERGLAPGEMIVTEGYHKLTPGVKVQVAPEAISQEENKADNDSSTTSK